MLKVKYCLLALVVSIMSFVFLQKLGQLFNFQCFKFPPGAGIIQAILFSFFRGPLAIKRREKNS